METIHLNTYGLVISDSTLGESIHSDIMQALQGSEVVGIDFTDVISMATFCSKQIFGTIYKELGPHTFFSRIRIINAEEPMRIIVRLGIEKALEDSPIAS